MKSQFVAVDLPTKSGSFPLSTSFRTWLGVGCWKHMRCCWIRPHLITNYTGAFCLVRCAHAIPQYALCCCTANKLICRRTAAVISLLNYCYFVWGAQRKIYDFIFWCSMPLKECCCVSVRSHAQSVVCLMGVCIMLAPSARWVFILFTWSAPSERKMNDGWPGIFNLCKCDYNKDVCVAASQCLCVKEEFGCYIKWRDLRCVVWELIARALLVCHRRALFSLSRIGSMLKVQSPAWLANYIKCESPLKLMRSLETRLSFPRKSGVMSSFMDGDVPWESHLVCVSALSGAFNNNMYISHCFYLYKGRILNKCPIRSPNSKLDDFLWRVNVSKCVIIIA